MRERCARCGFDSSFNSRTLSLSQAKYRLKKLQEQLRLAFQSFGQDGIYISQSSCDMIDLYDILLPSLFVSICTSKL